MRRASLSSSERIVVLNHLQISEAISNVVDQLYVLHGDANCFDVVGIEKGGAKLAQRIVRCYEEKFGDRPRLGAIDITLYRDDLYTGLERPALGMSNVPFSIDGRTIILIDDVLFTGRTVRAGLQELHDLGRPKCVWLFVLIDRGHRELPIQADYAGIQHHTQLDDRIVMELSAQPDERDQVYLIPPLE